MILRLTTSLTLMDHKLVTLLLRHTTDRRMEKVRAVSHSSAVEVLWLVSYKLFNSPTPVSHTCELCNHRRPSRWSNNHFMSCSPRAAQTNEHPHRDANSQPCHHGRPGCWSRRWDRVDPVPGRSRSQSSSNFGSVGSRWPWAWDRSAPAPAYRLENQSRLCHHPRRVRKADSQSYSPPYVELGSKQLASTTLSRSTGYITSTWSCNCYIKWKFNEGRQSAEDLASRSVVQGHTGLRISANRWLWPHFSNPWILDQSEVGCTPTWRTPAHPWWPAGSLVATSALLWRSAGRWPQWT